ncbi:MAG: hypothetical protein ABSH48_04235 [Verrucomicrobiota bacterium]
MTLSFLLLMGIFNHTDYNQEWSGFPYRLFVLPVPTWQLVALPMALGLAAVEGVYFAWIKLVWTNDQIMMPEWFAVVLGAYMIFFQTILWTLAAFRATRLVVLALGGVSILLVASLPFMARIFPLPWATEPGLMTVLAVLSFVACVIAWTAVARQRSGGGRRLRWFKVLVDRIVDAIPRRTRDFSSPAAAQFWFEWRQAGWVLPVCTAFVVGVIFAPITWFKRGDPNFANVMLWRLLATPVVLAFMIGKGFIKPSFWSTNLSVAPFLAARPLAEGDFIVNKLKIAAWSVLLAWLPVLVFLAVWLPLWANATGIGQDLFFFRTLFPNSWVAIIFLAIFGLVVLSWRCMVGGLWAGMSGKGYLYFGIPAAQLVLALLVLLACAIWSDAIDRICQKRPDLANAAVLSATRWGLAVWVIAKYWFAAFSWNKIAPHHVRKYLLAWSHATLGLVALAILAAPPFDMYRQKYIYLLAALLVVPFARLGLAPAAWAKNRHH